MSTNVDLAEWLRLCALLDDDAELAATVKAEAAREQGDPWAALIDALDDAGALAYMQWDDSGVELADALAQLPRVFRSGADLDEVGDVDGDLAAGIVRADEILAGHGLRVVHLDEGTDACPLVVVPLAHVAGILAAVDALDHVARVFD